MYLSRTDVLTRKSPDFRRPKTRLHFTALIRKQFRKIELNVFNGMCLVGSVRCYNNGCHLVGFTDLGAIVA